MDSLIAADQHAEILSFESFRETIIKDYRIAVMSRQVSLMGRREVLTGKAKFGIFGDGKELPQVAMAKFFMPGDWRSGYYRDQTWMFALGIATPEQFFSQLYADPNIENDPFSGGRQMNAHFTTKNVDEDGQWFPLSQQYNTATDMAPTAGQVPRALGLALASKVFREMGDAAGTSHLSQHGNEVCFCTIGDASTSEGHFWETMNAACVMQVPLAMFVWDDGYGISVPKALQTTKGSISEALKGLEAQEGSNGMKIYRAKAWDYAGMCEVFEAGIAHIRTTHMPALFHIEEVTQIQGHSTSGSHERYKSATRLEWEREWDCIKKFREWILANDLATDDELDVVDAEVRVLVKESKDKAWQAYQLPIKEQVKQAIPLLQAAANAITSSGSDAVNAAWQTLKKDPVPLRKDVMKALAIGIDFAAGDARTELKNFYEQLAEDNGKLFNTYLYNQGKASALQIAPEPAIYDQHAPIVNGYEVLNHYFDALFASNKMVLAFGEDVGHIGDVNQGFAGLQQKHGRFRIFDTGIREATIMGQGIGLALRGFRPIAEIQYLDYLLYGLQSLSDDVSSLHYRTVGQQSCPLIVRTRGHRLEGIWHSGSPMGMIVNSLRGMYVCVPRNMVQAVGMYNTLLQSNDPALIIESLNGYRLKEQQPSNLLSFKVALGVPEVLKEGTDITIVSYGSTLRIVMEAAEHLKLLGIDAEVIDVQTLLPFDLPQSILGSLKKTNRILFVDEDVPGGAAAYMYNQVMEKQGGYRWLDATPRTLSAQEHRPAYGSDGDYFSKPNVEDVVRMAREIMAE